MQHLMYSWLVFQGVMLNPLFTGFTPAVPLLPSSSGAVFFRAVPRPGRIAKSVLILKRQESNVPAK